MYKTQHPKTKTFWRTLQLMFILEHTTLAILDADQFFLEVNLSEQKVIYSV